MVRALIIAIVLLSGCGGPPPADDVDAGTEATAPRDACDDAGCTLRRPWPLPPPDMQ